MVDTTDIDVSSRSTNQTGTLPGPDTLQFNPAYGYNPTELTTAPNGGTGLGTDEGKRSETVAGIAEWRERSWSDPHSYDSVSVTSQHSTSGSDNGATRPGGNLEYDYVHQKVYPRLLARQSGATNHLFATSKQEPSALTESCATSSYVISELGPTFTASGPIASTHSAGKSRLYPTGN